MKIVWLTRWPASAAFFPRRDVLFEYSTTDVQGLGFSASPEKHN